MKITCIIRAGESKEVTVSLPGESFLITLHDFETLGIAEGDEVDEELYGRLTECEERLKCIKKAFDYLSYGDLSKKQLSDKLKRKFPAELSDDVAELFEKRGYVNDAELAKRYAETFYVFKNMGVGRIRNELYRRGFGRNDIEDAMSPYENEPQKDRIIEFINKKYDTSLISDRKYRNKVYSGAIRAGFPSDEIAEVLRNFESESY